MKFGQFAAMAVVTLFAIAVMIASGMKWVTPTTPPVSSSAAAEETAAPVSVLESSVESIEILQRYSGMIEPRERLTLAFEIPGRIETLGKNANGQTFDEGVRVSHGDILATLDTRELLALKAEADAIELQANQENERAIRLKQKNPLAINEVELLNRATTLKINEARAQLAAERLRNATLTSPVDGVISKRLLLPGESLSAHQPVFEILQVDRVMLVVGVPESRIHPLLKRYHARRRLLEVGELDDPFLAYYRLVGANAFGERWPRTPCEVHSISESSDDTTGLFNVEISIDNANGKLRPGQIAVAEIVADNIEGFRVPSNAGIFQSGKGFLYVVDGSNEELRAKQFELKPGEFLEQHDDIILKSLPSDSRRIVERGQHRLAPGRLVRIVETRQPDSSPLEPQETANVSSPTGK